MLFGMCGVLTFKELLKARVGFRLSAPGRCTMATMVYFAIGLVVAMFIAFSFLGFVSGHR
jgi:hypothetical protein